MLSVLAILISVSLLSCDLTENTSGTLSPDNFYETEADFQAALSPVYRYFAKPFRVAQGQLVMFAGDDMTAHPGGNKAPFRNFDRYNYSADANWLYAWTYQPYWKTIYAANAILDNLGDASLEKSFKNNIEGQARFMRGLSYYMLVRQYGGMPLITSASATGEETRATVLENYKLIEGDMKFAAANLPEQWEGNDVGKATSGAAKTVLSSLYLTWAGWPLKEESKYSMAAQQAKDVIDSGNYELLENYANIWLSEYDNNKEDVFAIQFSREAGGSTIMAQSWASFEEGGWVDGYAQIGTFAQMPEGPRKQATYQTTYITSDGSSVSWENSHYGHPTYQKWIAGAQKIGGNFRGGKNIPLFRYAQTLLIFAEARAMANGPDQQAYEAINKVRNRAGLPDLESGLSQSEFQDAVIQERAWEFSGEYTRWFDMVRTEIVREVAKKRYPEELDLFQLPEKPKHYLAPIPAQEMSKNPNLVQNPEGNELR